MQGEQGVAEPQGVGMLHGASDNKALIVSGCTSVHPYKYDVFYVLHHPRHKMLRTWKAGF